MKKGDIVYGKNEEGYLLLNFDRDRDNKRAKRTKVGRLLRIAQY